MRALTVPGRALTPSHPTGSETDDSHVGSLPPQRGRNFAGFATGAGSTAALNAADSDDVRTVPTLSQRLRHSSSILSIVTSDRCIYAGTQAGEILAFSFNTYERQAAIEGHRSSVLALCLSQDHSLLFSSAGDRTVNVWDTRTLKRKYCLLSSFDVGDIFCIAYSASRRTAYFGAQNTTIQWCTIDEPGQGAPENALLTHTNDPFFDSAGPGGIRTPRPAGADVLPRHAQGGSVLKVGKENVRHFAHYGYVYCMLLVKEGIPESAGQETLITGGGDGAIKIWKLDGQNGGSIIEIFGLDDGREEGHAILSMTIDGSFLYSSRSGGEIDIWDLETRQLVRNFRADRDDVLTVSIGGGFVFSAAITGYVRKYDRQHQPKGGMKAHDGRILASAFTWHKERPLYVTGSNDNTIAVWDISDCISVNNSAPSKTTNQQLVESLKKFVSYRTVSSDPRFKVDCRRGASYLRTVFRNFGAITEMLPTEEGCNPVILARFKGNPATASNRRKILFYGHYDVVAANNDSGRWLVDPFEMEGIDGYLYGRGTSDNKGPIMAAIFACAELISEQALGSDIIFLIEGEEECGSRGFEKTVRAHKDKIGDVDWILLANSYWLDDRTPCLTYGLRGVIHATVQIESEHPDLHSGVDGSSQLDEPLKDLVSLLGTLTSSNGDINIPGFYDPVPDVSAEEAALYAEITSALVNRNPGLGDPRALEASLMRKWRDASMTIHRFQTSGPDNATTIIPRLARAALSLRLVPNQEASDVSRALVTFLESEFAKLQSSNRIIVTIDHQAEPWLGDWTNQLFQTLEEAIMEAWGPMESNDRRESGNSLVSQRLGQSQYFSPPAARPAPATSSILASGSTATAPAANAQPLTPVSEVARRLEHQLTASSSSAAAAVPTAGFRKPLYIREGGSIPAIRFLEKELGAPAAHFPCGQASDSAHLDNERLRLLNLYKSKDILKKVFRELPKKV